MGVQQVLLVGRVERSSSRLSTTSVGLLTLSVAQVAQVEQG
jgi:hypothetical protein